MEKERGMEEYDATPALQEFPQLSWLPFFSPQNQGVIADYLAYLRASLWSCDAGRHHPRPQKLRGPDA